MNHLKIFKSILLSIILIQLLIPIVYAKSGHISLLTVSGENKTEGGLADLFLEIKPGSGNIYIDSFPLTKLDTQISTRFANEIACDFLKINCKQYDFFYTIRAKASIVGGPSAGAAITVLTISTLSDLKIDEHTIMTGTINSGGLIGPVAGIDEKIDAAINNGFTKIIVPKWQAIVNISKIKEKNLDKKITIVKAKNIEEALYHFTGKNFLRKNSTLTISKDYTNTMKNVAQILCKRSSKIISNLKEKNNSLYNIGEEFLNRSEQALSNKDYYSRASYCFTANLKFRELEFQNKTNKELQTIFESANKELSKINSKTSSKELKTLSDLETYMIVKERLLESKDFLDKVDYENISSKIVSYAYERLFSATAWSEFFNLNGKPLNLDETYLKTACLNKIAEAEERTNYLEIYIPTLLEETKKDIETTINNYNNKEYKLCIFKASKAKAETNILLTALSIQKEEDLKNVLKEKLEATKRVILEQGDKDMFPILGYSYYEYANSLADYDLISAMTFGEYALELSKLDMYFSIKKKFLFDYDIELIKIFIYGFITGAAVVLLLKLNKTKKTKKTKKKNKKLK